jgi:uncharacterized protein (UPF0212 family)
MPNYNVFLEGAWLVKDVATGEDAIGIAISEAGKRLNPKLEYVGVDVGTMKCAACEENFMSVYVVADTALVGLLFQMKVYEAESEEHAARIATSVIGKALRDVPLKLVNVDEFQFENKPKESGSDFKRGSKPRESGSDFNRGKPKESGSDFSRGKPKESGSDFNRGKPRESGSDFNSGKPRESGSDFSRGKPRESGSDFSRGSKSAKPASKNDSDRDFKEKREFKGEKSSKTGKKSIEYD